MAAVETGEGEMESMLRASPFDAAVGEPDEECNGFLEVEDPDGNPVRDTITFRRGADT
jgi:hypothetical protein